ncbi:MAG: hypothetical protein ACREL7_18780 [Longimicrobiales bacterium]
MDKEGVEMWVLMSEDVRAAVDDLFERNPAIGDTPLFPAPEGGPGRSRPWSRWHARDLHERAQRAARYGYSCPKCNAILGNDQANARTRSADTSTGFLAILQRS